MSRADAVRALALALPGAVEADHHGLPSFRVGGKIFATMRVEPARLMVKLDREDQRNLTETHPSVIAPVPGYWGRKGSTFVNFDQVDDATVGMLLKLAWAGVAPIRLKAAG